MSNEKIGLTIRPNDSGTMEFDGLLLRKAMHDQEFIEGIFQRIGFARAILKRFSAHLQSRFAKAPVDTEPFVGFAAQSRRIEVKL